MNDEIRTAGGDINMEALGTGNLTTIGNLTSIAGTGGNFNILGNNIDLQGLVQSSGTTRGTALITAGGNVTASGNGAIQVANLTVNAQTGITLNNPSPTGNNVTQFTASNVSTGDIEFHASYEGEIRSRTLRVHRSASIRGLIIADAVTVEGAVRGRIRAGKVILAKGASVSGEVLYEKLVVRKGAILDGHCRRVVSISRRSHSTTMVSSSLLLARPRTSPRGSTTNEAPQNSRSSSVPTRLTAATKTPLAIAWDRWTVSQASRSRCRSWGFASFCQPIAVG